MVKLKLDLYFILYHIKPVSNLTFQYSKPGLVQTLGPV